MARTWDLGELFRLHGGHFSPQSFGATQRAHVQREHEMQLLLLRSCSMANADVGPHPQNWQNRFSCIVKHERMPGQSARERRTRRINVAAGLLFCRIDVTLASAQSKFPSQSNYTCKL